MFLLLSENVSPVNLDIIFGPDSGLKVRSGFRDNVAAYGKALTRRA